MCPPTNQRAGAPERGRGLEQRQTIRACRLAIVRSPAEVGCLTCPAAEHTTSHDSTGRCAQPAIGRGELRSAVPLWGYLEPRIGPGAHGIGGLAALARAMSRWAPT